MKRAMSDKQILIVAAHYGITGSPANIIQFAKYLLKKGSDADVIQFKAREEKK